MATLSTIADVVHKRGRMTSFAGTDRLCRAALGALHVVGLSVFFVVTASAQQNPQPQPEPAPPVATDLHPRHPYLRRLRVGSNHW